MEYLKSEIISFDKEGNLVKRYTTAKELLADGFDLSQVHKVCKKAKGRNSHRGLYFRYGEFITPPSTLVTPQGEIKEARINKERVESWEESKDAASLELTTDIKVRTLEDLIASAKVDTTKWEVESWSCNTWEVGAKTPDGKLISKTLYQVKAKLKRKKNFVDLETILDELLAYSTPTRVPRAKTNGRPLIVGLADFHVGALGKKEKPYTHELKAMLEMAAKRINSQQSTEVHLMLAGDFIESFSGLNHLDSWQELEYNMHGANVIIVAAKILADFCRQINNIASISLVSGNHDRTSSRNDEDTRGNAAILIAQFMRYELPEVTVDHNPLILKKIIDDICYILYHGHTGISKRNPADIVLDHGIQGKYNVLLHGHDHRHSKKEVYRVIESTPVDKAPYGVYTLKPLITGGYYSESIGQSSTVGMELFQVNLYGKLEVISAQL